MASPLSPSTTVPEITPFPRGWANVAIRERDPEKKRERNKTVAGNLLRVILLIKYSVPERDTVRLLLANLKPK
jgi:hypothetical protein